MALAAFGDGYRFIARHVVQKFGEVTTFNARIYEIAACRVLILTCIHGAASLGGYELEVLDSSRCGVYVGLGYIANTLAAAGGNVYYVQRNAPEVVITLHKIYQ